MLPAEPVCGASLGTRSPWPKCAHLVRRQHPHGAENHPPENALGADRGPSRPPPLFKRARARSSKLKSLIGRCALACLSRESRPPRRFDSSFLSTAKQYLFHKFTPVPRLRIRNDGPQSFFHAASSGTEWHVASAQQRAHVVCAAVHRTTAST